MVLRPSMRNNLLQISALVVLLASSGCASGRDVNDRPVRLVPVEDRFGVCPGIVVDTGSKSFCVLQDAVSWVRAVERCADEGLRLATIDTPEQHRALIAALAPRNFGMRLWVGLTDAEREGDFRWLSGEVPFAGGFRPGEPNDQNGEDCGELIVDGGGFNDVPCSLMKPVLCEARVRGR